MGFVKLNCYYYRNYFGNGLSGLIGLKGLRKDGFAPAHHRPGDDIRHGAGTENLFRWRNILIACQLILTPLALDKKDS